MLHINGEIGGGVPLGMFGRVPDPQPFTFLGAGAQCTAFAKTRTQTEVAKAQQFLRDVLDFHLPPANAGRDEQRLFILDRLSTGGESDNAGQAARWSHDLLVRVNERMETIGGVGALLNLSSIDGSVGTVGFVRGFIENIIASAVELRNQITACEQPRAGMSTGAKVALGVGAVVITGGVIYLAMRPRAAFSGARRRRKAA